MWPRKSPLVPGRKSVYLIVGFLLVYYVWMQSHDGIETAVSKQVTVSVHSAQQVTSAGVVTSTNGSSENSRKRSKPKHKDRVNFVNMVKTLKTERVDRWHNPSKKKLSVPYDEYQAIIQSRCRDEEQWHTVNITLPGGDNNKTRELCPCLPGGLRGRRKPDVSHLLALNWTQARFEAGGDLTTKSSGGHWAPIECTARRRLAVIIPFRDREQHLRAFLAHTHPILQRQLLEYRIFVVEQEMPYTFSKGSIMNIGYLEARKRFPHDCVLFHDVDQLIENDDHMFICGNDVSHMVYYISKKNYSERYQALVGGGVLLRPETFENLNGFADDFFGWGGEDDEFANRIRWQKLEIFRAPQEVGRYTSVLHSRDKGNKVAKHGERGRLYLPLRYQAVGLNSVRYDIIDEKEHPLYTWLHARLKPTKRTLKNFPKSQNFTVLAGMTCGSVPNATKFTLSRTSCHQLCISGGDSCVAVRYVVDPEHESYCQLSKSLCPKPRANRREEIHVKFPGKSPT